MVSYGNNLCFDGSKLGRDSSSSYNQYFCDLSKFVEFRFSKMNLEGGYGKLGMDFYGFSDFYMMDGFSGSGYYMLLGGIF